MEAGSGLFNRFFLLVCDAVKIPECFIRHDPRIQKGDSASVNPDPKRIPGLILQQVGNKMIGASRYNIDRFHRIILSVNALKKERSCRKPALFHQETLPKRTFYIGNGFFAVFFHFRSVRSEKSMNDTFMKERPVLPLLLSMALPNVISMLVNSLYNIVDSLFVAQISEDAMTALSLVYPIQNFANAIAIGFGIGINAMIALYLGAGDRKKAEIAATHGMVLSLLHGVVITVVSIAIMPGFLRRFTTDESLVASGITYSTIVFLFATINMAALAFEKMFQAVGRMKVTMVALVFGCVCNILLDPVLIFGLGPVPAMGIAGAALATGIGQLLSLCVYLFVYLRTELPVRLSRSGLHPDVALDGKLYAIGVPAILNLALPSLLVTFLNSLLAGFSQSYVVILGIYYKLQTFLYLPANGIVQGMRPLIGYNYGAREHARVKKLYELTLFMSIAIMALGTVICLLASGQLIGLFTSNPDTIAAGAKALRIICIGFVVSAVSTTSSGALEGLGKGVPSLVISLCRYVVFIMPLAAVLCGRLGPDGVWHAFWITEVLTALVAYPVYHRAAARH